VSHRSISAAPRVSVVAGAGPNLVADPPELMKSSRQVANRAPNRRRTCCRGKDRAPVSNQCPRIVATAICSFRTSGVEPLFALGPEALLRGLRGRSATHASRPAVSLGASWDRMRWFDMRTRGSAQGVDDRDPPRSTAHGNRTARPCGSNGSSRTICQRRSSNDKATAVASDAPA
jgi:hypothetical protein